MTARQALQKAIEVCEEQARGWCGTGLLCATARAAEAEVIAIKLRSLLSSTPEETAVEAPRAKCRTTEFKCGACLGEGALCACGQPFSACREKNHCPTCNGTGDAP